MQPQTDYTPEIEYRTEQGESVQQAVETYFRHGFEPIPLHQNSKTAVTPRWQDTSPSRQWTWAGRARNIGLRAGKGIAFIDCDDKNVPGTSRNVIEWMAGRGYMEGEYPLVRTPNGGHHIYVYFDGVLIGSKRDLRPEIGAGDFRYGEGAYVVAPPSVIETGSYELVSGDLARLPRLSLADVQGLVRTAGIERPLERMPALAKTIASGIKPGRYASNSEAEFAMIVSLVNAGYTENQVKAVFDNYPCLGHYKKHADRNAKEAQRWFTKAYRDALSFSQTESETRQNIKAMIAAVESMPFSNANRRQVYLYHLRRAYAAGKTTYNAAMRDIALGAGVGLESASNQTKALIGEGLLQDVATERQGNHAKTYCVKTEHILSNPYERICTEMTHHEAFRNGKGRLGIRTGEIYTLLLQTPMSVQELAKATKTGKRTIERATKRMSKIVDRFTGEVIEMVYKQDGKWHAREVDLDLIAEITGTKGLTERRKAQFEKDRRKQRGKYELYEMEEK